MNQAILDYNNQQGIYKDMCHLLANEIEKHLKYTEVKIWHGSPVWFIDGNPIVGYHPQKHKFVLMFWSGADFELPGLVRSGSFRVGQAEYQADSQIDLDLLKQWLLKSMEVQWDYKNIRKNKGKLSRL